MARNSATILILLILTASTGPLAFADDKADTLIEKGRSYFERGKFVRALDMFRLAGDFTTKKEHTEIISLYTGAVYAEFGRKKLAAEYMSKYLAAHPRARARNGFTDKMKASLEEARGNFPIVTDLTVGRNSFKPYAEKISLTFDASGGNEVLAKTRFSFLILALPRREAVHELPVVYKADAERQTFEWDGKNKFGAYLEPGTYVFSIKVEREDHWTHSYDFEVTVGGNMYSPEIVELVKKLRRIDQMAGKLPVNYLPRRPKKKIGEEPLTGSSKGFWNLVYYVFIGSIRDGLDFPVKFLCSQPGVGHVLTFAIPVYGAYEAGDVAWKIDKEDYYNVMTGLYDESAWDHDKGITNQRVAATTVLGSAWIVAYAYTMSFLCWAGTDQGFQAGVDSYIQSNAVFGEGYKSAYFFPNYRSLTFSDVHVDDVKLEALERKAAKINEQIDADIKKLNDKIEDFNNANLKPLKRKLGGKFRKKLHDTAEMTVRTK